jgi:dTDP-4-dehydrorhamnose reductase
VLKLIVTGASGMIGSRFVSLLSDDIKLVASVDRAEGLDILDPKGLDKLLWPVLNENGLTSDQKVDAIVHLAAFTDVDGAAEQDGDVNGSCYQINVTGTKNIVELAKRHGCRLIHISTDFVFDGSNPPAGGYTESDQPNPIEWYGKTKYEAEKLVQMSSIEWCIARTAYPFVAWFPTKLDLVRRRIKQMRDGSLPPQFTDHAITPTFVDELAAALMALVRQKAAGVYHLVGSESLTDFEISKTIKEVFGFEQVEVQASLIEEFNKKTNRPYQKSLVLSNEKFEKQFGKHFSKFREALQIMKNHDIDVLNDKT